MRAPLRNALFPDAPAPHAGHRRLETGALDLPHGSLQAQTNEPDADYVIPFGKGRIMREGKDLTIVAWAILSIWPWKSHGNSRPRASRFEIIDLRSIVPLDEKLIAESVRKTSHVLVAHEDSLTMGFGAEVAARIGQNCFEYLDAPVRRVAAEDTFVPTAPNLEALVLPSAAGLRNAAEDLLRW